MKNLRFLLLALTPMLVLMLGACASSDDSSDNNTTGGNPTPTPTACADLGGADGYIDNTTAGVWEIYNQAGLDAYRTQLNSDNTTDAKLMCDIALSTSRAWVPMGSETNRFSGTFDGNNYIISNLNIEDVASSYQGFFAATNTSAVVKNIVFVDAYASADTYVAIVAGRNYGDIINVHVDGINGTADVWGNGYIGIISGRNEGRIIASSATNVRVMVGSSATGIIFAGGIASSGPGDIVASYVDGITINGSDLDTVYAGGLVGFGEPKIYGSFVNNITFTSFGGAGIYTGGIIGSDLNAGTFDGNSFVSTDATLYGNGLEDFNRIDVFKVDTINSLNLTSLPNIQAGIDAYVTANGEIGYTFRQGSNVNTQIPTLVAN